MATRKERLEALRERVQRALKRPPDRRLVPLSPAPVYDMEILRWIDSLGGREGEGETADEDGEPLARLDPEA